MVKAKKEEDIYPVVRHTITNLYRIKTIDRRKKYDPKELKLLVLATPTGKEVISKLKQLKITRDWLITNNFGFFEEILGDCFSNKRST